MARQQRPDGRLVCVAGASRSGKTVWTAQQVAKARRLLVWDPKPEWLMRYQCRAVGSLRELAKLAADPKPCRLAFHHPGMLQEFEPFCRLAWVWLRAGLGTLVVDELADVTQPGKAPAGWGTVCRMGLGFGATIYALTQRPAESDKTAFGNATVIHAGRQAFPRDRTTMAEYLSVPVAEVAALRPLEWIEYHADGTHRRGVVKLPRASQA